MSTPFLVALSIINVLFALMVLYFAARLNWWKKEDRPAIVWLLLLVVVLSADTAAVRYFVRSLP
jgi:hypothetical protein